MKKIIFTIALFVVSNCLLASKDVIIKYYTKTEFKSLDSNKRKNIQTDFKEIKLYNSAIDGEWGAGVKKAFDTIKARLAFMNKETTVTYIHSEYQKMISPRLFVHNGNEDNTEKSDEKEEVKNNNTLLIVIILLLVLNLVYLLFKHKIDKTLIDLYNKTLETADSFDERNLINEENVDNKNEMSVDLENEIKRLQSENESLKLEVNELKSKNVKLESEILSLKSNSANAQSAENASEKQFENEISVEKVNDKIIYAQIPDNDIFNRISDSILNSNFVFKLIINGNNAEFNFIENDKNTTNLLKSDPETYLVPFFQKKGLVTSNFKITKPGKAKLENGKWKIIEKGTVEFY
jgi:hypothetical protein